MNCSRAKLENLLTFFTKIQKSKNGFISFPWIDEQAKKPRLARTTGLFVQYFWVAKNLSKKSWLICYDNSVVATLI
jgi:hypothetical protein